MGAEWVDQLGRAEVLGRLEPGRQAGLEPLAVCVLGDLGGITLLAIEVAVLTFRPPYRLRNLLASCEAVGVGSIFVVVLTGFGSIATAVEAMQLGARNYLTKPCDADRILSAFNSEPSALEGSEPVFETPSLARIEREHIERVLRECSGNISKTARVLGIHRRTLQYKLAKFPVNR